MNKHTEIYYLLLSCNLNFSIDFYNLSGKFCYFSSASYICTKKVPLIDMETDGDQHVIRCIGKVSEYFMDGKMHYIITSILKKKFDQLEWQDVAGVLAEAVSQRHEILKKNCESYFLDRIEISNACSFLDLAAVFTMQKLYEKSLSICIDAAFLILDTEDFYQVRPATAIAVASQPKLNVFGETQVFLALWVKATLECCRSDLRTTYHNVAHFFKAYSGCINFEGIDEQQLKAFNNDDALKYYEWRKTLRKVQHIPSRKYRIPSKLDPKFFVGYETNGIEPHVKLNRDGYEIKFSVPEAACLIQVRLAHVAKESPSHRNQTVVLSLKRNNGVIYEALSHGFAPRTTHKYLDTWEYVYSPLSIIKLYPNETYTFVIEGEPLGKFIWPVASNNNEHQHFVNFHCKNIACLTELRFVRAP